jgi:hypothetical protein
MFLLPLAFTCALFVTTALTAYPPSGFIRTNLGNNVRGGPYNGNLFKGNAKILAYMSMLSKGTMSESALPVHEFASQLSDIMLVKPGGDPQWPSIWSVGKDAALIALSKRLVPTSIMDAVLSSLAGLR